MHIIFNFWSFEISAGILENKENYYRLRFVFSPTFNILAPFGVLCWSHLDNISPCIVYPVERWELTVILFGSMLPNL